MRKVLGIVFAVILFASCGSDKQKPMLLIIGDSLTVGIERADIRDRLITEQGWGEVVVDALSGRVVGVFADPNPTTGIRTLQSHLDYGLNPDAVIVALGTNDMRGNFFRGDINPALLYDQIIRQMLDLIGPIPVAWVNVVQWNQNDGSLDGSQVFNDVLAAVALDYPNLIIGDWYSAKDVLAYWGDDHLHPNHDGYVARASLYRTLAANLYAKAGT